MATTSLSIGNELLSTTMHILMKDFRHNVHESVAFNNSYADWFRAHRP